MALLIFIFFSHPSLSHLPKSSPRDRLRVIQTFTELVPKGQQIVEEVRGGANGVSEIG